MEARLQALIAMNQPENRYTWAKKYKEEGKGVIGVFTSQMPDELIFAAGLLPVHITGTWSANVARAVSYRTQSTCSYCNHVLEAVLSGDVDFMDGLMATDKDQDIIRLFDVIAAEKDFGLVKVFHAPMVGSGTAQAFYAEELHEIKAVLEEYLGQEIAGDAIRQAITVYNRKRVLIAQLYEFEKREHPPLMGSELLGITTAARVMPADVFTAELEALMPYIESRMAPASCLSPRILLSSDGLDNPEYIRLIEEAALVVMDDMDTGYKAVMYPVAEDGDWAEALAEHYVLRHSEPRMANWSEQIEQIIGWVKEYRVDGVISMPLTWCYPQRYRWPLLSQALDEISIPNISLEREYHFEGEGQLRTRIGAFSEMFI